MNPLLALDLLHSEGEKLKMYWEVIGKHMQSLENWSALPPTPQFGSNWVCKIADVVFCEYFLH